MSEREIAKINKQMLIASIGASDDNTAAVSHALEEKIDDIFTELRELRKQFSSSESAINKKLFQLQEKVNQQAEIIARQQSFLISVDRRERETRRVVLDVPDEDESGRSDY